MAGIGVAISGGGYRATTWALGALLYLVDAEKNREVTSMSSVSGGSIANGIVAHELDFAKTDSEQFARAVSAALRHVAQEGLIPGPPTKTYLAAAVAAAAAAALGLAFVVVGAVLTAFDLVTLPWLPWVWLPVLIGLAVFISLFTKRSEVVDRALGRVHFAHSDRRVSKLVEVDRSVDHIFCATELQSGDHLYFSPRFAYSYRFGVGGPADLPLSTAVQASACLPGAFRPRRLPTGPHAFQRHPGVGPPVKEPSVMVLVDGGVYDNMADQWQQGFGDRAKRWADLAQRHHEADDLIVVNASAGWEWEPLAPGLIRTEVAGLKRSSSIMYDVTTSHRRKGLVGRFERAVLEGKGMRGALVHIPQSPFDVADAYAGRDRDWPDRSARARAVLSQLGDTEQIRKSWDEAARRSADVGTVLSKLGGETTIHLLHHAYVLAMCNLHVILDYPLLGLPTKSRFEELIAKP